MQHRGVDLGGAVRCCEALSSDGDGQSCTIRIKLNARVGVVYEGGRRAMTANLDATIEIDIMVTRRRSASASARRSCYEETPVFAGTCRAQRRSSWFMQRKIQVESRSQSKKQKSMCCGILAGDSFPPIQKDENFHFPPQNLPLGSLKTFHLDL